MNDRGLKSESRQLTDKEDTEGLALGSSPSANSGRKSLKGKPTHRPSVTRALALQAARELLQ